MPKSTILFNKPPSDPRKLLEEMLLSPKISEEHKEKIRKKLQEYNPPSSDPNEQLFRNFLASEPDSDIEITYNGTKMN